jgi:hypothetical protein
MLPVVSMKPTTDKRSRLQVVAPYIKNGTVLFPGAAANSFWGRCSISASNRTMTFVMRLCGCCRD